MSTLTDILNALKATGVTDPTAIHSFVTTLSTLSPTSPILGYCNQILANASNPTVIKDLAVKIAEVPGCPAAVMMILPALSQEGATPMTVIQAVQAMETALGSGQSGGGFNVFGWHL